MTMEKTATCASQKLEEGITPFQIILLVLSVYVLVALILETILPLSDETATLLGYIDTAICFVFLYDFFQRLYLAPNRMRFAMVNCLDFISSIPMVPFVRWGRVLRVIRLFRILRAFRSSKVIIHQLFRHRGKGVFASVCLIAIILTIFASIAILNVENVPEANIKTPADALWWSAVTVTTVGYGDRFPVTSGGRIIAIILMVTGIGLFGAFTALFATFILTPEKEKREHQIESLVQEIRALRRQIGSSKSDSGPDGVT